jgi:hypothetical protein
MSDFPFFVDKSTRGYVVGDGTYLWFFRVGKPFFKKKLDIVFYFEFELNFFL